MCRGRHALEEVSGNGHGRSHWANCRQRGTTAAFPPKGGWAGNTLQIQGWGVGVTLGMRLALATTTFWAAGDRRRSGGVVGVTLGCR
eukprot:gene25332-biopygen6000